MINRLLYTQFPTIRQILTRITYKYLSLIDKDQNILFMNYGFANLDLRARSLEISDENEKYRYEIQLYHHLASSIEWKGLDALEVSSGRGGGSHYIKNHFKPKSLIGVDISREATRFCNKNYSINGLSFVKGNAESLRFPDNSFDVVINVEASLYYPHVENFFRSVVRVLKPNGHFLYTDMRYTEELKLWREQLKRTGLELLREENITPNVIKAIDLNREHRLKLLHQYIPGVLHRPFSEFSGINGAGLVAKDPKIGERTYWSFVFRKSDT